MFRFDAKKGLFLCSKYEETQNTILWMNRGVSFEKNVMARSDVCVLKHGLRLPKDAGNYVNINYGNNRKLLKACKPLAEYSYFVKCIRKNLNRTNDLKQSISESINMMPDDYVLKPILNSHRAEVMDMCVLEYTQEKADEFHKAEINRLKDEALKEKNRADDAEKRADNAEKILIDFLKNSGKTDDEIKEILHQYEI